MYMFMHDIQICQNKKLIDVIRFHIKIKNINRI